MGHSTGHKYGRILEFADDAALGVPQGANLAPGGQQRRLDGVVGKVEVPDGTSAVVLKDGKEIGAIEAFPPLPREEEAPAEEETEEEAPADEEA